MRIATQGLVDPIFIGPGMAVDSSAGGTGDAASARTSGCCLLDAHLVHFGFLPYVPYRAHFGPKPGPSRRILILTVLNNISYGMYLACCRCTCCRSLTYQFPR